ncbi:MAG: HepT-like ribonuclease domain-containing protein [Bacteroidota bacterium]
MLRQAVERNIEIIGEALNNALKLNPSLPISNARKIVDTRNRIIHGYDEVEDVVVWSIVIKHLPLLKNEVGAILPKK